MKSLPFIILLMLFLSIWARGQNCTGKDFGFSYSLNGSFESFKTTCSNDIGPFLVNDGPINWKSYSQDANLPAYYNSCSSLGSFHPSANYLGTQQPITGNGFIGLRSGPCFGFCEAEEPQNEYAYVMQELSKPLVKGVTYYIEFNVSLADASRYGVNSLGLYLTDNVNELTPPTGQFNLSSLTPQIPNIFPSLSAYTNYTGWTKICGYYTATKSGVKYIVIGNFSNGGNYMQSSGTGYNGSLYPYPYYYIDDVYIGEYSCCLEDQAYKATSNLPSRTSVNNEILAGSIGVPPNTGDVVVLNGQNVTFKAGKTISLKPGFRAELGASFSAKIGSCEKGVDDNQLKVEIQSVSATPFGNQQLISTVTGGSGSYIYEWSNGATTSSIVVPYAGGVRYTLVVTDAVTDNAMAPCDVRIGWKEYISQCPICRSEARTSTSDEKLTSQDVLIKSDAQNIISVYPNPSKGVMNIKVLNEVEKSSQIHVHVLDLRGSIVAKGEARDDNTLDMDLSYLPEGVYIVFVKNGSRQYSKKIVINR